MHTPTPSSAPQVVITDAELRHAFTVCRGRRWPERFEDAMADPTRARLVMVCAHGLRNKTRARNSTRHEPRTTLPQQPLLAHWPSRTTGTNPPRGGVDLKRAAAGDRDDD